MMSKNAILSIFSATLFCSCILSDNIDGSDSKKDSGIDYTACEEMGYEYYNAAVALLDDYSDCEIDNDCKEIYLRLDCTLFGMTGRYSFCSMAVSVAGETNYLAEDRNLQERICRENNLYCPLNYSSCSMIKPFCKEGKCDYIFCVDHYTECQDAGSLDR